MGGHLEVFKRVLEAYPAALTSVAGEYGTPLTQAVCCGNGEVVTSAHIMLGARLFPTQ